MLAAPGVPAAGPAALATATEASPGSLRSLAEFHPLIILYITTKITQKITSFNGINKLSQSILPSLSTCNFRSCIIPGCPASRQQENKWRKSANLPSSRAREIPGRALRDNWPKSKTPENWYSSWGVWEFWTWQFPRAPPVLQLSTGYPHLTVDNSSGVWEF